MIGANDAVFKLLLCLVNFCRELRQEKKDIRLAIIPLLQAEEDARFVVQVSSVWFWSHYFLDSLERN